MPKLPDKHRPNDTLNSAPIIDIASPNPLWKYLKDCVTSPVNWGIPIIIYTTMLIVGNRPWQGWLGLIPLLAIAWCCTRTLDGRWRNLDPDVVQHGPEFPGWKVTAIIAIGYVALVIVMFLLIGIAAHYRL